MKLKDKINRLYKLAFTDKMTRCFNRNWLEEHQRHFKNKELDIAIIDLNKLKETNDKLGHDAGDKRIKNLAKYLKQFGKVVRFGGDEFLVIFDENKATVFEEQVNNIEFSYGISKKEKGQKITQTMRDADKKMYQMKKGENYDN